MKKHPQSARVALAKGDIDQAKRELKLSIQDNPIHAESHFLLASLSGYSVVSRMNAGAEWQPDNPGDYLALGASRPFADRLITFFFRLAETGDTAKLPLITIPAQ